MSNKSVNQLTYKELPFKAKAYIVTFLVIFIPLFMGIFLSAPFNGLNWFDFIIFLILAIAVNLKPLTISKKSGSFTISSIIWFAVILLFRPPAVFLFVLLSSVVSDALRKARFWQRLVNVLESPIFCYLAALTYNFLKASSPYYLSLIKNLPALIIAVLTIVGLNVFTHSLLSSFIDKLPLKASFKSLSQGTIFYEFSQYPVSVLLAMAYHYQKLSLVLFIMPFLLFYLAYHNQSKLKIKEQEAIKDPLTLLYNRRYFNQEIGKLFKKGNLRSFSLIIFDLDNFKNLNDTYGHLYGDQALKTIAKITLKTIRSKDIAVRYGGEEFSIVLPLTPKDQAFQVGERLRRDIENVFLEEGKINLTISMGVASFPQDGSSVLELITKADAALYKAKSRGKNIVIAA